MCIPSPPHHRLDVHAPKSWSWKKFELGMQKLVEVEHLPFIDNMLLFFFFLFFFPNSPLQKWHVIKREREREWEFSHSSTLSRYRGNYLLTTRTIVIIVTNYTREVNLGDDNLELGGQAKLTTIFSMCSISLISIYHASEEIRHSRLQ